MSIIDPAAEPRCKPNFHEWSDPDDAGIVTCRKCGSPIDDLEIPPDWPS
jgi:hypothetical protein